VLRKPLEDDSGAALGIRKVMSQLLLERDFSAPIRAVPEVWRPGTASADAAQVCERQLRGPNHADVNPAALQPRL